MREIYEKLIENVDEVYDVIIFVCYLIVFRIKLKDFYLILSYLLCFSNKDIREDLRNRIKFCKLSYI